EVVGGSAAPLDELVAGGVLPRLGVEAVEFGLVYQGEVVAAVDLAVDLGVAAGLGEAPSGGIVADSAVEGVDDAGQQRVAVGRGGAAFGEREQRRADAAPTMLGTDAELHADEMPVVVERHEQLEAADHGALE